jgi:hypothetical protein
MYFAQKNFGSAFFRPVMGACALAMLAAIGVYAYLGTFSRYLSDDYCEANFVNKDGPVIAVIDRYVAGEWRAANRYSNLLFVGFGELLGEHNMPITTAGMVLLWPIGLSWSVHEFRKLFKVDWPVQTDCFLGATLGFFILLQAPNLFQTIYWRSSMMTHFAPIVFGSLFFAFWLKQARRGLEHKIPRHIQFGILFGTFILAGFSEPPVTTMVTALGLSLPAVWFWVKSPASKKLLTLLAWTFAGAFLGLMVMVLSPANFNMTNNDTLGVIEILRDSFSFSYIFVLFSFKEIPLPNILSAAIPALVVLAYFQSQSVDEPRKSTARLVWTLILVSPFVMWILIAAGFSPSVYGQGFPVERMRFLARSIMSAAFMFEGALIGLLLRDLKLNIKQDVVQWIALGLLVLTGFVYPIRAAVNVYPASVPEYQARAEMWDLRDAYIKRHAAAGEQDIIVPGYSGVYSIKELDDNPEHWVNICAARFYGVNSIRAVSIPEEYLLEALSE